MKIKENKGFAITALLYGLSIMGFMTIVLMMSIMQNSRKNNTTTVKAVEQELNNYGSTATNYNAVGENTKMIPSDQAGYYKIELCGNKTLLSGTVYFPGNTNLSMTIGDNASVSVAETEPIEIMSISPSAFYINGSAQSVNNSVGVKRYPVLNPQIIKESGCANGFKMGKVSNDAPQNGNNIFDGVTKIETQTPAKINVVFYNPTNPSEAPGEKICDASPCILGGEKSVSDIYINYTANPEKNTQVKLDEVEISPTSPNYKFDNSEGYSFSRFGPVSSSNIMNGNYIISMTGKNGNYYKISNNKKDTLTTSAYTPSPGPGGSTMCQEAHKATNYNLIHYGSESLARPVLVNPYASKNSQKWRFDFISANHYKITEIEEYKPFEVHKQDSSLDENGPILVCGEYICNVNQASPMSEEFKSTDSYRDNINQKWVLTPVGLGTYIFQTNEGVQNSEGTTITQYLYYKTDSDPNKRRFLVTSNQQNATLFYIFNANL